MIGQVVEGHEILRPLGVGGMGEVYLARATAGDLRALKIVRTDRAADLPAVARFRREVLTLGKLRHPGIVEIVDAGRLPSGELYLAMEYVAGPDLQAAIGWDGPFGAYDTIRILAQLAAALAYAHGVGVIHRDLKPANVLLADGDPGRAKIIDFGLAKVVADEHLTRLTDDQDRLGSPQYWAPEQSTTAAVGPEADVYALGGLAFYLLSGQPMFGARPAVAMVYAHVHEPAPSLAARCKGVELPPELEALIARCVAKPPGERPSAGDLVLALDPLLARTPNVARGRPAQRLFTRTGLSNLEQAVTSQIRQVLLDLATVLGRSTDDVDRIQGELSELELDLAMLDSELEASSDPDLASRRATLAATVASLQQALAEAFRALFTATTAERAAAAVEAAPLFDELDALVEQYRTI